ncbi:MAG: ABC transporter ATP-binding protein [Planctomycetota bacterium]
MSGGAGDPPVIALRGLSKRYGAVRALDGLTLDVPPGPVGLLGPNGAGKTTLLKVLLGLLAPDRGTSLVAGCDPATRHGRLEVRRRVGYMPEGDCLLPGLNAVELVATLGRLAGLTRRDAMTRTHEVLDYVGLEEARYRSSDEYSGGMKQRLKLAQSLVHDPDLLLLDEPTNGLDPHGRRHMLELVADLGHAHGKNILLCSHLLPDVEATCREVIAIHHGAAFASGVIAELTRGEEAWTRAEVDGDVERFAAALAEAGLEFRRSGGGRFLLHAPPGGGDEVFALARRSGAVLTHLASSRVSLEDVFLRALHEAEAD